MEQKQPKGPFCQSCGMPMNKPEDFGTNADDSKNEEYCKFCYQDSKFTNPNMTMEQMIDKVTGIMAKMQGMPEDRANEIAKEFIPKLKRWQK